MKRLIVRLSTNVRAAALAATVALATALYALPADARDGVKAFVATLNDGERKVFEAYYGAITFHRAALDAYWAKISAMRVRRRARLRRGGTASARDYVQAFPPKYTGPRLSKSLRAKWAAFNRKIRAGRRPKKRRSYPTAADYLALAKKHYGFQPERIPEREFKRRYASEALRLGLTKDQVIRVYALETGGRGTADMVAGVSPVTGRGRPISSALGYAQLLAANTINVLQKSGAEFDRRLRQLLKQTRDPKRRVQLTLKIRSLGKMRAVARRIPRSWSAQRRLAATDKGRGMHAINMDGDIGPWLQVKKLRGVRDYATRAGYKTLRSEHLELMNLAGPGTGLEMMTPHGLKMPTSNFFSRLGYERNSVVRGRTSAELIVALGKRMDSGEKKPGAVEFAKVFDDLMGVRQTRNETPQLKSLPRQIFYRN